MSFDVDFGRLGQSLRPIRAVFFFDLPIETGLVCAVGTEVFGIYPAVAFVTMPPFGPSPQDLMYPVVDVCEDLFTNDVAVIVGPTSDDRVELGDELPRR